MSEQLTNFEQNLATINPEKDNQNLIIITNYLVSFKKEYGYFLSPKRWLKIIEQYEDIKDFSEFTGGEGMNDIPDDYKQLSEEQIQLLKNLLSGFEEKRLQELVRTTPTTLSEARKSSESGDFVDISSLGITEKRLSTHVQIVLDNTAEIMGSDEYKAFKEELDRILEKVTEQHFIFDIEKTVLNTATNGKSGEDKKEFHYSLPWMQALVMALHEKGNKIGFWTATTKERLGDLQSSMNLELSSFPAISIDEWTTIIDRLKPLLIEKIDSDTFDSEELARIHDFVQQAYPISDSDIAALFNSIYSFAKKVSSNDPETMKEVVNGLDPKHLKLPQAIAKPENSFLIDDYSESINGAVARGWPKERAIQCKPDEEKTNALEIAKMIAGVVKNKDISK